jgi:hypothetical protein
VAATARGRRVSGTSVEHSGVGISFTHSVLC